MEKPIHICVITSAHPVDDVRVNHKICQALRGEGFRVSWVGPNHAFFDVKNFNRYGIEYSLFPPGKGKLGRLSGAYKTYFYGRRISDVQIFYAPDPDAAAIALLLAKRHRAKVIFDIHEDYHDAMLSRWLNGALLAIGKGFLHRAMSMIFSRCDLVLGVSNAVLKPYNSMATETMVVRSCAPLWFAEKVSTGFPKELYWSPQNPFTIMHGKANLSRGTGVVLEALSLVNRRIHGIKCKMFDTFTGTSEDSGLLDFHLQVEKLDLNEVVELQAGIPMEEMPSVVSRCNAGLIAYGRRLGTESLPNKLFEYMAAGVPIIAPSYSPEIRQIVETEKCGLLVDFENPEAVADAIIELIEDPIRCSEMGKRGHEAFLQRHNWQMEVQPLLFRIHHWYSN